MSDSTAIQPPPSVGPGPTSPAITGAPPPLAPPKLAPRSAWYRVTRALKGLASLRLTVFLFVLSILLVFYGTVAQIDSGIWTIMRDYFRSFMVWIPLQLNVQFGQVFLGVPKTLKVPGSFPFPGGLTIGSLLLINLLAAHTVRFKLTWKRSGIFLIHAGLIVLMLGELITGQLAVEGRMSILTGRSSNYVEDFHATEIAFTYPIDGEKDHVVVLPGRLLRRGGTIQHDLLPCDVEVRQFMVNSALKPVPPDLKDNPKSWEPVPPKGNVFAAFRIGEGAKSANFTVSTMSRNFGDLHANYNRWLAQVGNEEISEEAFAQLEIPIFHVAGKKGHYFDVAGPRDRILLVVAPSGDAAWFYKLMGPREVVEAQKATFKAFVGSLRYFDENNPATKGDGLNEIAVAQPEVSGTATDQTVDVASTYVTLKEKETGKDLGTYLLSAFLTEPQEVRVGGKAYQMALRFKRTYKPYTIHLEEFTHAVYPGTDKPKDFASQVELTDQRTNEKQKVRISMNNPLHYDGETFYQASVLGKDQGTVLQVVDNPGWMMPYLSCVMVALGMIVHFGLNLVGFLKRRAA